MVSWEMEVAGAGSSGKAGAGWGATAAKTSPIESELEIVIGTRLKWSLVEAGHQMGQTEEERVKNKGLRGGLQAMGVLWNHASRRWRCRGETLGAVVVRRGVGARAWAALLGI